MKPDFSTAAILWLFLVMDLLVAAQQPAPYRLTLQDAIQKALQANLGVLVAGSRVEEAEGTRERRMSVALLPRVSAQANASVQNRNLRAFGISLPGMPEVVGPFSNYDFRISAQQNIADLQSLHTLKASERALDAGRMDLRDARDLVVRSVAGLYLSAQSASARVEAAHSRVTDSSVLCKLAKDKHDAGTATGVDVLRAEVQLANDKQGQLVAENQFKQLLLALERNIGMAPGALLDLADPLRFQPLSPLQIDELAPDALLARADYLSLAAQREGLLEQQRANRARRYPKMSINGNLGEIGRSIGSVRTTGLIEGEIDFSIFDRDRDGEAQELASRVKRIDDQIADLRRGIDEDLRDALLSLDSAGQQVAVSQEGEYLARRELTMAEDRFLQGTANNVEVVTAQDQLARAEENTILAVSSHVDAKFALARAMGDTDKNIALFAGNQ